MGHEAGRAVSLRDGSRRREERRRRVRPAPRSGLSGQRESGDESLAGIGRGHARSDAGLLLAPATERRAHRGVAASSVGNDSRRQTKAPVLLGELYPVGRVDELKTTNELSKLGKREESVKRIQSFSNGRSGT